MAAAHSVPSMMSVCTKLMDKKKKNKLCPVYKGTLTNMARDWIVKRV